MNIESKNQYQNTEFQGGSLKGALNQAVLSNDGFGQDPYLASNPDGTSFKDILNSESIAVIDDSLEDILNSLDIIQSINLDTLNIDKADAMFFINALNSNLGAD